MLNGTSLIAQSVKSVPAMQETWVRFLVREDPLEKEMATHSSILAWRIPWTNHGVTKSRTPLSDYHFHFHFSQARRREDKSHTGLPKGKGLGIVMGLRSRAASVVGKGD